MTQRFSTGQVEYGNYTYGNAKWGSDEPEYVVWDLLNTHWDSDNVTKPKLLIREEEYLYQDIPNTGLILLYQETGGMRRRLKGNWETADETIGVVAETHSLSSREHMYILQEEIDRISEVQSFYPMPALDTRWHTIRLISRNQEYGETFQVWRGNIRLELTRNVRTNLRRA